MTDPINRARQLRKNQSPVEGIFWSQIRNRKVDGWKFRRQVPIGPYFADFVCPDLNLVVELDGGQHGKNLAQIYDAKRTRFIENRGYEVWRVSNLDVLTNLEGVLDGLLLKLNELSLYSKDR